MSDVGCSGQSCSVVQIALLLSRLMGQYCFARMCLLSIGVVCRRLCNAVGGGRMGGRAADTARRVSAVTSLYGDTLLSSKLNYITVTMQSA